MGVGINSLQDFVTSGQSVHPAPTSLFFTLPVGFFCSFAVLKVDIVVTVYEFPCSTLREDEGHDGAGPGAARQPRRRRRGRATERRRPVPTNQHVLTLRPNGQVEEVYGVSVGFSI